MHAYSKMDWTRCDTHITVMKHVVQHSHKCEQAKALKHCQFDGFGTP